jgi:hypothetical protein
VPVAHYGTISQTHMVDHIDGHVVDLTAIMTIDNFSTMKYSYRVAVHVAVHEVVSYGVCATEEVNGHCMFLQNTLVFLTTLFYSLVLLALLVTVDNIHLEVVGTAI